MEHNSLKIQQTLSRKLIISIIGYTVAGFVILMIFQGLASIQGNAFVQWINARLDLICFFYLIIGWCSIFFHFWKKPWDYLENIVEATQTIYEQNDTMIHLPNELQEIETQMNQIKMSVLVIRQAVKEAEDKKNDLVMYLAHDIRTPLTTVIGYLSLLSEAPDMPTEQKTKYVGIALDKAEKLEKLLNELFEITRYHSNMMQIKQNSINLQTLISQIAEEFYPQLHENGNELATDIDDIDIVGDAEKLARVFSNLIKNAISYSYKDTEIAITAHRKGNICEIIVMNEGNTIESDKLERMFDKFQRLDNARQSGIGGIGLGLSIAREIITLHGGTIIAKSKDHQISFVMTLPINS